MTKTPILCRAGAFLIALAALHPSSTLAGITNIADTAETSPYSAFALPSINSLGVVVFQAGTKAGGSGIFLVDKVNAGVCTPAAPFFGHCTIADTSAGSSFQAFRGGSIGGFNGSLVVFSATLKVGGQGIYASPGADFSPVTIVDASGQFSDFSRSPAISPADTIAFKGTLDNGQIGIFTINGDGRMTTIANSASGFSDFGIPSINTTGEVAFGGLTIPGGQGDGDGIYLGRGDAITTIADRSGRFKGFGLNPSINDPGEVVFNGLLDDGEQGIFLWDRGFTTTLADSIGRYTGFGDPWIAGSYVTFRAQTDKGGHEIVSIDVSRYGNIEHPVISTGSALFGATVIELDSSLAINEYGSIAFGYKLSDGRRGIALWTEPLLGIPEPSPLVLIASCLVGILLRRSVGVPRVRHFSRAKRISGA